MSIGTVLSDTKFSHQLSLILPTPAFSHNYVSNLGNKEKDLDNVFKTVTEDSTLSRSESFIVKHIAKNNAAPLKHVSTRIVHLDTSLVRVHPC